MIYPLVLEREQVILRIIAAGANAYTTLMENDDHGYFLRKTFVHGSTEILGVICYPYC